jgi:hypothetical protein
MEKSKLEKLSLIELKNICKKEGLNFDKSRNDIILALNEYFEPMRLKTKTQVQTTSNVKPKTKSVKTSDKEQLNEMGREVEKNRARILYYANDCLVFELLR